jgi:hypothetical protein
MPWAAGHALDLSSSEATWSVRDLGLGVCCG